MVQKERHPANAPTGKPGREVQRPAKECRLVRLKKEEEGAGRRSGSGTRRPLCASAGRPTPRTQEMRRTWASWGIA